MKNVKKTADKNLLSVTKRTVFGKNLKALRQKGQIPANIFGPDFKSLSVNADYREFVNVHRSAKETQIVYVKIGEDEIPVLIKNIQKHPVSDKILHIDFRRIDLKQKIATKVPVRIVGQSTAVTQLGGVLLTQASQLLIEALPQNIPQTLPVEIGIIKEIGQEITVADLPKSSVYEIKDDPKKVIVSVIAHKEESTVAETTTATPDVITAKPEETAQPSTAPESGKTDDKKEKETPPDNKKATPPKKTIVR